MTLVVGSYIVWVNHGMNISQTTALLLPLTVIGIVHLLGAGIAIPHALKTGQFIRNILVYSYFLLFFFLAIWIILNHYIMH